MVFDARKSDSQSAEGNSPESGLSLLKFHAEGGDLLSSLASESKKEQSPALLDRHLQTLSARGSVNLLLDQKHGVPQLRDSRLDIAKISYSQAPSEKQKWTIVMSSSIEFSERGDFGYSGGEAGVNMMATLKELTRDKPVSIVLQTVEHRNKEFQKLRPNLYTYVLKDGEIKQFPQEASEGYVQDLQNLLQRVTRQFPSEHISLKLNAHGAGNAGISVPDPVSLEELASAIKNGLSGSGHEKLDILHFDACLMGQSAVLQRMRAVASGLIASPEIEYANSRIGKMWVAEVLANPDSSPETLLKKLIGVAKEDRYGGWISLSRTPALTAFNLERAPDLNRAVNQLGYSLAAAIEDPDNFNAIKDAIVQTPKYGDLGGERSRFQKRDLGAFLDKLSGLLKSGRIQGDTGSLSDSIMKVRTGLEAAVTARYLDSDYSGAASAKLSGLSVNLPDMRTLKRDMRREVLGAEIDVVCNKDDSPAFLSKLYASRIAAALPAMEKWSKELKVSRMDRTYAAAESSINEYASIGVLSSSSELEKRKQNLCSSVDNLFKKTNFSLADREAVAIVQMEMLTYKNGSEVEPGWNEFVRRLVAKQLF